MQQNNRRSSAAVLQPRGVILFVKKGQQGERKDQGVNEESLKGLLFEKKTERRKVGAALLFSLSSARNKGYFMNMKTQRIKMNMN